MHTVWMVVLFSVVVGGGFIGVTQAMRHDSAPSTPILDAIANDFGSFTSDVDGNVGDGLGKAKGGVGDFFGSLGASLGIGDPHADDFSGEFAPLDDASTPPAVAADPAAGGPAADVPPGHLPQDDRPSDNAGQQAQDDDTDGDEPAGHLAKDDKGGRAK